MIGAAAYGDNAMRAASLGAVLCVEDDSVVQIMLGDIVRTAGASYHAARSAREAEELLALTRFDLILLDRRLPDSDGLLLLQTIRKKSDCPVLVLSSLDEARDKILGLGLGADEYLTKPFSPVELGGRVRALLRRERLFHGPAAAHPIDCGELSFWPETRCLRIHGRDVFLPPAEARLLHALLRGEGEAQSRDGLTRFACGRDWFPGDRSVDVLIARLRRRIPPEVARIVTVHRFGYALRRSDDA